MFRGVYTLCQPNEHPKGPCKDHGLLLKGCLGFRVFGLRVFGFGVLGFEFFLVQGVRV